MIYFAKKLEFTKRGRKLLGFNNIKSILDL